MTRRRLVLFTFAFVTVFGLLEAVYRINDDLTYGRGTHAPKHIFNELTATWSSGLLFVLILPVIRRFRLRRGAWLRLLPIHAGILVSYSLVHNWLMWAIRTPLYPPLGWDRYDYGTLRERIVMEFSADVFAYTIFVALVHGIWIYHESRETEAALVRAQLETLQARLQPHFLFNSLNAISNLIYEDPRRADEMIGRLSELLRRTLNSDALVPLSEEVRTTELYLDMMQIRFEDRLAVDIDIDPSALAAPVPHMLLQPLVENSLRHGVDPRTNSVLIRVAAHRANGTLHLEVADRGPGQKGDSSGHGLRNTRERLEKLFGASARFRAADLPGGGFRCQIEIPCAR